MEIQWIPELRQSSFRIFHYLSFPLLHRPPYRLERENCQQQQHPQLKPNNPLNSFTTIAASFNNSLGHGNNGSAGGPLSISHLNAGSNSNNNSINSGQQLQLDPLSLNSDSLNYEQNLSNVSNAGNSNLFGMNLQPSTSKINDSGDLHNNIMHKYALQPIMLQNSLTDEQNELMEFKKKGVYFYPLLTKRILDVLSGHLSGRFIQSSKLRNLRQQLSRWGELILQYNRLRSRALSPLKPATHRRGASSVALLPALFRVLAYRPNIRRQIALEIQVKRSCLPLFIIIYQFY